MIIVKMHINCFLLYFQVKLFCEWLIVNKFHAEGRSLINMPIQRLPMPWRDAEKKVDCGVFAMCHIETYMIQRVKDWNSEFAPSSTKTLQVLRVKYCKVLLTCEANHLRKENIARVEAWFKGFRLLNVK